MLREVIRAILQNPMKYGPWSLQGFGMLRLHLSDEVRLNVWHRKYQVENVSLIHDHPWDFRSQIISGTMVNKCYAEIHQSHSDKGLPYHHAVIVPGPKGGKISAARSTRLAVLSTHLLRAGEEYEQHKTMIHKSLPDDGCVTLNIRKRGSKDQARVFWPYGEEWVDAKPRDAEAPEIEFMCAYALKGWDE